MVYISDTEQTLLDILEKSGGGMRTVDLDKQIHKELEISLGLGIDVEDIIQDLYQKGLVEYDQLKGSVQAIPLEERQKSSTSLHSKEERALLLRDYIKAYRISYEEAEKVRKEYLEKFHLDGRSQSDYESIEGALNRIGALIWYAGFDMFKEDIPQPLEYQCPECEKPLKEVTYPSGSMLNEDQWSSQKAGDFYCDSCPGDEAKSGHKYYWKKELEEILS